MITDAIANRHLLAVDGLQDLSKTSEQRICIVVAKSWASSHAGQLLTSCLVNLLCRQVKLVSYIEVASPETPLLIKLPCGDSSGTFPACMKELAAWAVNGAVSLTTQQSGSADYTVFIGEAPEAPNQSSGIVAIGNGWRAWVGELAQASPHVEPASPNPLGPFLAAALAAGEIFKRGRGIKRGKFLTGNGYSLWTGASSQDWDTLEDGPTTVAATLPPIHVVGAGAVGNALGYIIANLGLYGAYVVLIDDDSYDDTNLNRCLLAGAKDVGQQKVYAIERALKVVGIGSFPFVGTIKSYTTDARNKLRADVAQQVNNLIFSAVVSCVDKGTSRQDIQGLSPELLVGGSTHNLQAKSNLYSGCSCAACLACFNPKETDGEKIRALEDQLRKMSVQERMDFLTAHGLNATAIEEYLSGVPCGGLGEAALRDYAVRPPAEFSVGFVSLGAGLLVASLLLRSSVFKAIAPSRGDMSTLNFLNGGAMDVSLAADDSCELACQSSFS